MYVTLHYITLHRIASHRIALGCTTLHYIALHYITLHYITLSYITLHYITLHYITLHYITLHTYIHTCYIHTHIYIYNSIYIYKTIYIYVCIYIYINIPLGPRGVVARDSVASHVCLPESPESPYVSHGFEVGSHLLALIGSGCCASSLVPVKPHGGWRFRGQVPRPFPNCSRPHWKNQVALPENGTSLSTGPTFLSSSRIVHPGLL